MTNKTLLNKHFIPAFNEMYLKSKNPFPNKEIFGYADFEKYSTRLNIKLEKSSRKQIPYYAFYINDDEIKEIINKHSQKLKKYEKENLTYNLWNIAPNSSESWYNFYNGMFNSLWGMSMVINKENGIDYDYLIDKINLFVDSDSDRGNLKNIDKETIKNEIFALYMFYYNAINDIVEE